MSVGKILRTVGLVGGVMMVCVGAAQAAICFLPDCQVLAEVGTGSDGEKKCLELGYQKLQEVDCGENLEYDYCPDDLGYAKCNGDLWCLENGYDKTECNTPEYLAEQCLNGAPYYKSCMADYERACKNENEGFVNVCPDGWLLDAENLCSYSNNWGICCNTCLGYEYSENEIPLGYVKDVGCKSCGGIEKYKIKEDPCSGYMTCQNAPQTGVDQCLSGTVTKYKECCPYNCVLSSCPIGTICTLETCSNKYCSTGCISGYTEVGGSCCNTCMGYDYTEGDIPNGYVKDGDACSACGGVSKFKIKANPCDGYTSCSSTPPTGTPQCLSGEMMKYKQCCPYSCSLASCPTGTNCSFESCSGKYCAVGCLTGYEMSGGNCKRQCVPGDILYWDKTCDSEIIAGKTVIGVIIYVEGSKRAAINLEETCWKNNCYWHTHINDDIPGIPNYRNSTAAIGDLNGRANSYAYASYFDWDFEYDNNSFKHCLTYKTTGTNEGDWYLPAAGELRAAFYTNKNAVVSGLEKAGGITPGGEYFSSSEFSEAMVWYVNSDGYVSSEYKYGKHRVKCALEF